MTNLLFLGWPAYVQSGYSTSHNLHQLLVSLCVRWRILNNIRQPLEGCLSMLHSQTDNTKLLTIARGYKTKAWRDMLLPSLPLIHSYLLFL